MSHSSLRKAFSPKRFYRSLMHALRGVQRLFLMTHNALIHACVAIAVIIAAIILGVSSTEWAILLLCIGGVLSLEAVNTALESLANQVSTDHTPLIRDAKDLAAGAVLIASISAAIIGLIIFIPHILHLFG